MRTSSPGWRRRSCWRSSARRPTLEDGTRIALRGPWDEPDDGELDDTKTTLSRLQLGEQFVFEFDFGDSWMHLCTVADEKVDPHEVYGEPPERPVAYWGWGWIPDQYGRRWDGDDGASPMPPPPDPPLSDLPDLRSQVTDGRFCRLVAVHATHDMEDHAEVDPVHHRIVADAGAASDDD